MKRKRKNKRFIQTVCVLAIGIFFLAFYIDFIRFPECYMTTWKYQLQNEINSGNEEAIDYYNRHYVKFDRELFHDQIGGKFCWSVMCGILNTDYLNGIFQTVFDILKEKSIAKIG